MPAYPDEDPDEGWKELRVTLGSGMVTLRREPGRIQVVIWGNADASLLRAQETILQACAEAGGGEIS